MEGPRVADAHHARANAAPPAAVPARPKRLLVVDDDAAFRLRLVKALTSRGLEAFDAATADQAVAVATRVRPKGAIVDLCMPGANGLDLVRRLLALDPAMQVVVLTGYGSIATAVEAVRSGAVNYLTKPLDTEQILAAFDRDGESPEAPAPAHNTTPSLARVEWEHIQRILTDCDGNISWAARKLGLHRRSLQRKLAKLPPSE